jgi:hypothetical protein
MNGSGSWKSGHEGGRALHRTRRLCLAILAAAAAISAGGCGGSGSSGSRSPGRPIANPAPPPARDNNVTVTVTDVFGAPVAGADIRLYASSNGSVIAGADGRAEFFFPEIASLYGATARGTDSFGSAESIQPAGDRLEIGITVHPAADPTAGIASITVPSGGVADDGRSLEFNIRFLYVLDTAVNYIEDWNMGPVNLLPCEPNTGNDSPQFTADCVDGPDGFDAPYVGTVVAANWVPPDTRTAPLAVSLLTDQGGSISVNDPADRRLLAANYLMTRLGPDDQVVVAAFASNDASIGQFALLPNTPVTIFPLENPEFTANGRGYFSTIDSLSALEGGASPLYASLDQMLDFTEVNAPADAARAVVVISSGDDESCGSRASCWSTQRALLDKGAAAGIFVAAIRLADPSGRTSVKALSMFAQGENGATFRATDPRQVATIMGTLPAILHGRGGAVDATIHLQSPVAGAFASGRIVYGQAQLLVCPWDSCDPPIDVPFAVRIP